VIFLTLRAQGHWNFRRDCLRHTVARVTTKAVMATVSDSVI
jgi:hypothetical protein